MAARSLALIKAKDWQETDLSINTIVVLTTSNVVAFHTLTLGVKPNSEEAIRFALEHRQVTSSE